MKSEILYIQSGSLANYIGTHFWNTQESYFTYDGGSDPLVFHDRSFREGQTVEGASTYCPRLLIFDTKSHFGYPNNLYDNDDTAEHANQWMGDVVEYRTEPIPQSIYHAGLEKEEKDEADEKQHQQKDESMSTKSSEIRFWSDYSRVYFHPRSLQRLPDPVDWQTTNGDWNASRECFRTYESEHDLLENAVRLFAEECDGLQAIQVLSDCTSYGGFTDALLTSFRDEYLKLPSLVFPLLSKASHSVVSADEADAMKALNDALSLRGLETLSTINVPIQDPSTWCRDTNATLVNLKLDTRSRYHTSALLSTHIESATLPLRLKTSSSHDFWSMNSTLNPSGIHKTVHLAGTYPYLSPFTHEPTYDFSTVSEHVPSQPHSQKMYARIHVTRGLDLQQVQKYNNDILSVATGIALNPSNSIHAPAYPTPSSFPPLALSPPSGQHSVLSTLTASSAPSRLFAAHARLAQECVDRRAPVVERMGLELDELRELKDDLWALYDRYAGDGGVGAPDEEEQQSGEDDD